MELTQRLLGLAAAAAVLAPLAGAAIAQVDSWDQLFKSYKSEPRKVSGRLTLKGGTPLVGWTVSAAATKSSIEVSAREGLPVATDATGAFAYESAMTGWVSLDVNGPWASRCFGSMSARLTPEDVEAEIVVDAYLLQAEPSFGSGRHITAQPILRSHAELGVGWTAKPPMVVPFRASAGSAKALVPAGASYLVTKQRPGKRPLVSIVDGTRRASIIDIDFQESLPSLATFTVSTTYGGPSGDLISMVELRPIWDPAAPVCTPRPIGLETGIYRGVALPGRYRVVAWVRNRGKAVHFVEAVAQQSEVTLEAGKDMALSISSAPVGGIRVYPNWPNDLAKDLRSEPCKVRAEFRLSGTKEWVGARLLHDSSGLVRAPLVFGRLALGRDSFVLERGLVPGEYQVRVSVLDRVSVEAAVVVGSRTSFTPCHLAWE